MIIIEKSDGTEASRWNSLTNISWPDGSTVSGSVAVGDQRVHVGRRIDVITITTPTEFVRMTPVTKEVDTGLKDVKGKPIMATVTENEEVTVTEDVVTYEDVPDPLDGQETYTVKEVFPKDEGEGPRNLGTGEPVKVGDEWHRITTFGAALPDPVPGDEGYDHVQLRRAEIGNTLGGGVYEDALGNQLDAIAKWQTSIRDNQSALEAAIDGVTEISAASRTALKTALSPVFNPPADVDDILTLWDAAKTRFPKE